MKPRRLIAILIVVAAGRSFGLLPARAERVVRVELEPGDPATRSLLRMVLGR